MDKKLFTHFHLPLISRWRRNRLRAIIRGYNRLKLEDQLGLPRQVSTEILESHFDKISDNASRNIFFEAKGSAERAVRQYAFARLCNPTRISRELAYSRGVRSAMILPLPRAWQSVLVDHGIRLNHLRCSLAWHVGVVRYLGRGILMIVHLLVMLVLAQRKKLPSERYVYFAELGQENVPQLLTGAKSYDICSWYASWEGKNGQAAIIKHNVHCEPSRTGSGMLTEYGEPPYLLLRGWINLLRFSGWGLVATSVALFDLLRGHWWHALMLGEAARAKAVQLCKTEDLALEYLFHNSGVGYRPLWTYDAEKRGARVICYHYSTFEQPKMKNGYSTQKYDFGAANWPLYLVWDKYQANQYWREIGPEANVAVVGPIWFSDAPDDVRIPEDSIGVFNVDPWRIGLHLPISTIGNYAADHPDFNARFLEDIQQVLTEHSLTMAWKKKRDIGERLRKADRQVHKKLATKKNVVVIPPSISAIRLVDACQGTISIPFTSTALFRREEKMPSIYYDPTGWIQRDDRGAHGIPIVVGIDELRQWVGSTF